MSGGVLRLKRGHDRPRLHPWIFKGDVADVTDVAAGSEVTVIDSAGRFVGRGHYNSRPALCCRILTRHDESLDADFFHRRLQRALERRGGAGAPASSLRLVWSEGDELPGLVVDRYGPVLVVQCLTLGMASARTNIVSALRPLLGNRPVLLSDDAAAAALEGFEPGRGWLDRGPANGSTGAPPDSVVVEEGPVRFQLTLGAGHKTGLYLDQADNRVRVGPLARGRAVLDVFAYAAGFACHALTGGGVSAVCLESGAEAIAAARGNLALNGVAERAEIRAVNAFDELRRLERVGDRFGLVVLDPPPFARGRATVEAAARGYKEINLRAMRLLEPGGILATFSCSYHVSPSLFEDICREAATDSGITLRVLDTLGQSGDHPVLLTVPETRYLKGLLLEAV